MLENGGTVEVDQPLAPLSRVSIDTNDVIKSAGFATEVRADLPIVVERAMYFGGGGGHGTIGVKTPGQDLVPGRGRQPARATTPGSCFRTRTPTPSPTSP